jgi:putative tricarboxylic transport membrane protein
VRRADRLTGIILLAFAVAYGVGGARYPYWAPHGPGSGFFPRWLALAMGILAALLIAGTRRGTEAPAAGGAAWRLLPESAGLRRLLAVLGATLALIALLTTTGMTLGIALFLLVVLRLVEGYGWGAALAIAVGTALANYLVFTLWLRIPFPEGPLGF